MQPDVIGDWAIGKKVTQLAQNGCRFAEERSSRALAITCIETRLQHRCETESRGIEVRSLKHISDVNLDVVDAVDFQGSISAE